MWFIPIIIIAATVLTMTVQHFRKDILHNFSSNSVPLLKVSFISFMSSGNLRNYFHFYKSSYSLINV